MTEEPSCKYCGSTDIEMILTPELPHYAKDVCRSCGRHLRWLPKPDAEKVKRPAAHRELVRKYAQGYCELCMTAEDDLPDGQVLEAQHVVDFADGGGEGRENIWIVCTKCHKLIHWVRQWAVPK